MLRLVPSFTFLLNLILFVQYFRERITKTIHINFSKTILYQVYVIPQKYDGKLKADIYDKYKLMAFTNMYPTCHLVVIVNQCRPSSILRTRTTFQVLIIAINNLSFSRIHRYAPIPTSNRCQKRVMSSTPRVILSPMLWCFPPRWIVPFPDASMRTFTWRGSREEGFGGVSGNRLRARIPRLQ